MNGYALLRPQKDIITERWPCRMTRGSLLLLFEEQASRPYFRSNLVKHT